MRTTISIDEKMLEEAKEITGIKRTSDLLNKSLSELVRKEAAHRLAALGGTMPKAYAPPRRNIV